MTDQKPAARSAGGRPRGFDREEALAAAMELFWSHGYEGVSLSELTAAMGVAPQSLYAAFGSKAALYREALDRYAAGPAGLDLAQLDQATSLADAVEVLLVAAVAAVTASGRACMITSGMLACGRAHAALAEELAERRRAFRTALEGKLLRWAAPSEAAALARYLVAIMQGLSAQARDGASPLELADIAERARTSLKPRVVRPAASSSSTKADRRC